MKKDWTGNSNSVWKTLGASNHTKEDREANDYYATSAVAIDLLKKKVDLPKQILEPACGAGHLSIRLEELGHDVYSSDLIDRGFGKTQDFFAMTEPPFEGDFAIVTNPPYSLVTPWVLHSLELVPEGSLVCMFLKTTFAESKGRYEKIFRNYPPPQGFTMRRTCPMRQKRRLRDDAQERRECSELCLVDMDQRLQRTNNS